jgi:hypothetical protein
LSSLSRNICIRLIAFSTSVTTVTVTVIGTTDIKILLCLLFVLITISEQLTELFKLRGVTVLDALNDSFCFETDHFIINIAEVNVNVFDKTIYDSIVHVHGVHNSVVPDEI